MHKDLAPDSHFEHRQNEHGHFLFEGVDYPATREELVAFVTDAVTDPDLLNLVRNLPDRTYESTEDVWRAMGEATRRFGLGGRRGGTPRDDIGKQWTVTEDGVRRP